MKKKIVSVYFNQPIRAAKGLISSEVSLTRERFPGIEFSAEDDPRFLTVFHNEVKVRIPWANVNNFIEEEMEMIKK